MGQSTVYIGIDGFAFGILCISFFSITSEFRVMVRMDIALILIGLIYLGLLKCVVDLALLSA